jgi:haloalkane dehalogenase
MDVLRTPDERFVALPDFSFEPHYLDVPAQGAAALRVHYLDEGPADAEIVLCMHGEPSWSFLYRKVVPVLVDAGLRVIAPDLVGFGRSDKPTRPEDYTYQRHVDWMLALVRQLDLERVTLLGQDWGGLIGLRLLAEDPGRFLRAVAANTFLPTGDQKTPEAFFVWQRFSQEVPEFPTGNIVAAGCRKALAPEVIAAYDAPFPDERYKAGARRFPLLVPTSPDDPATLPNRRAWEVLGQWQKPFLTAFSDGDPMTRGAERYFQTRIPGAQGQPHTVIQGGGHFLQEDQGEALGQVVVDFIAQTPA